MTVQPNARPAVRKLWGQSEESRKTAVYCRVSSAGQKDDLVSQKQAMEQFCLAAGIAVDEWIDEIGDGMSFKRKKFLSSMSRIASGEIEKLLIAHKDRLVRFGFDYFDHMAVANGCKIVVVNQESLSPQQEMVERPDVYHPTFSCRLYGLRKYQKSIKKMIEEP